MFIKKISLKNFYPITQKSCIIINSTIIMQLYLPCSTAPIGFTQTQAAPAPTPYPLALLFLYYCNRPQLSSKAAL